MRYFILSLFAALALVLSTQASAADGSYLEANLFSYHFNPGVKHNHENWGLGYEYNHGNYSFDAGYYRNSFWTETEYALAGYRVYNYHDKFGVHIEAGISHGYTREEVPTIGGVNFLAGVIGTYDYKRFGVNVVTVPVKTGFIGLQVKYKVF